MTTLIALFLVLFMLGGAVVSFITLPRIKKVMRKLDLIDEFVATEHVKTAKEVESLKDKYNQHFE